MITEKYYFLEKTSIDINSKYPTLWDGFLTYERKNDEYIEWAKLKIEDMNKKLSQDFNIIKFLNK